MLLKCNECGHENQLGAIFCRECGTKLDVEKMRPQVETKSEKNIAELVKNIVAVVVLLSLVLVIGLMFYPQSGNSGQLSDTEIAKTEAKFNKLMRRLQGDNSSDSKYVFSPDEATYLFNNKMTSKSEGGGPAYTIQKLHISLDAFDNVVFIAESKFMGIPVSFALRGYLEDEQMKMKVRNAKMGHLSIPSFVRKKIISKFTPALQLGIPAQIIQGTTKIIVENGDFHITVESPNKKKK